MNAIRGRLQDLFRMNALVEVSDWIWTAASSRAAHSVRVSSGENRDISFLRFGILVFD